MRSKADERTSLIYARTEPKTKKRTKKNEKQKPGSSEKKPVRVIGREPGARNKTSGEMICKTDRFSAGSEREREGGSLSRVVNQNRKK